MKAKQVYEFIQKKSLKNNIKIGLEYKKEKEIKEWLNKNLINNKSNFEVNNSTLIYYGDFKLKYNHNTYNFKPEQKIIMDYPFDKLIVHGNFACSFNNIINLPNNLEIKKSLFIFDSNIEKLPKNLKVGKNYELSSTKITEFLITEVFGDISFEYSDIQLITDNLIVHGSLDISNTKIEKLPNNLKIGNYLAIDHSIITELPNDLEVNGPIYVSENMYDLFIDTKFGSKIEILEN